MGIWQQLKVRLVRTAGGDFYKRYRISRARKLVETVAPDVAAAYLQESLRLFAGDPALLLLHARQLQTQGDVPAAIASVVSVTETRDVAVADLIGCAELCEALGQFDLSETVCERLSQHQCPKVKAHGHYLLARLKFKTDQREALKHVTRSICLDNHKKACSLLYSTNWRDQEALRSSLRLLQEAAKSNTGNHLLFLAVGDVATKLKEFDTGAKYIEKAVRKEIESLPNLQRLLGGSQASADRLQPSFLIIGAMKCGTSSLFSYIQQHPGCVNPVRKELNFFNNEGYPLDWYLSHFPASEDHSRLITGEASPGYFHRDVQERVKLLFPKMKLICILRNPARRTLSQFHHARKVRDPKARIEQLTANIDSYREINEVDDSRAEELLMQQSTAKYDPRIAFSFYCHYLRRWTRCFPRDQLMLLSLKDLKRQPEDTMRRVFEFLEVEPGFQCQFEVENRGKYSIPTAAEDEALQKLEGLFHNSLVRLENEFAIHLGDV